MLKKIAPIVFLLLGIFSFANAQTQSTEPKPEMVFEETSFSFGDIHQGDKVVHIFKFKNKGKAPLVISNATATCGCTIPEYPKEPVAPGRKGEIKVEFNSAGKMGQQNKVVTITHNGGTSTVTITSNVLPPAPAPATK